jgi:hypothetical protein
MTIDMFNEKIIKANTFEASAAWHPTHPGGSTDILPFYEEISKLIPVGGCAAEVGSFFGRSLSFLGLLRPDLDLWAIDQWEDTFVDAGETLPVGPDKALCDKHGGLFLAFLAQMQEHAPSVLAKAHVVRAKSSDGLKVLPAQSCDFIFIDAGHSYNEVILDIAIAQTKMKHGGVIAGHDYCWGNDVTRAVKSLLPNHELASWDEPREGWESGKSSVWFARV